MPNESIRTPGTSNNFLNLLLDYVNAKIRVKFRGSCLKQDKGTYNPRTIVTIVNIYIVFEISKNYNISSYPTLENCLFGAVILTKNADMHQYKYSGYGIGFDRKGELTFGNGYGRNVIVFGVNLTNSSNPNNKINNALILGKDFIKEINGTKLYTEKMCSTNFTENNEKNFLSHHCNGDNSYLFVNGTEVYTFKAKDSENVPYPLSLGNISKGFSVDHMKMAGLNGYVYDFSVHYDAIAVDDILDIIH